MSTLSTPPILRPSLRMTEDEFVRWAGEDTRAEWVDGEVYLCMGSNLDDDELIWWIRTVLTMFLQRHSRGGRVCGPNFTCRLPQKPARRDPDVMYVAPDRMSLLHQTYFDGAPDLVVEVVSPDSQLRDWHEKFAEYQAAGVREYWIVSPGFKTADLFVRSPKTNDFERRDPDAAGRLQSSVVPGFWMHPDDLFAADRPDALSVVQKFEAAPQ
jgi:Uma2 family endonuclease